MSKALTLRVDLLDRLTVVELDIASRILKEDIVHAITAPTAGRWRGVAVMAYMLEKKNGNPTSRLDDFLGLGVEELLEALARLAGDGELVDELEEAETELERLEAATRDELEGLGAAAEAASSTDPPAEARNRSVSGDESDGDGDGEVEPNPTRPTSAFSSRARGASTPSGSAR